MRFIHPAVWIGLLINIFFMLSIFVSFSQIDGEVLAQVIGPDISVADLEYQVRVIYTIFMFFQILSVIILKFNAKAGILLAVLSGLVMLPLSLLYILGVLITYFTMQQEPFYYPDPASEGGLFFQDLRSRKYLRTGFIFLIAGLAVLSVGLVSIGVFLVFAAPIVLFLGLRARKYNCLEIYDDSLMVFSHILGRPVLLPFADIQSASIMAGEIIQFNVKTDLGLMPVDCNLQNIFPDEQKKAVESVARVLTDHGVDLH